MLDSADVVTLPTGVTTPFPIPSPTPLLFRLFTSQTTAKAIQTPHTAPATTL